MRGAFRTARSALAVSAVVAAALAAGVWQAFSLPGGRPVAAAPARAPALPPRALLCVALGDSLTRGRGDESGQGYVGRVAADLRRQGAPVEAENLAVDGMESGELARMVEEPYVRALLSRANLVLLSIGGNDLSHAVAGDPAGAPARIAAARARLARNLDAILGAVRRANPRAQIRLIGLYDPFEFSPAAARSGAALILEWDDVLSRAAAAHGAVCVPIFDLFTGHAARLSSDHFHPGAEGYRLIAERVAQSL